MDDGDDAENARPPEPQDLRRICQALNAAHARYVLIGGYAMVLHGAGRTTMDIDLLIDDEVIVDLLARACEVDYAEAILDAETHALDGIPVKVASKPTLLRTKRSIRERDRADSQWLESQIAAEGRDR